ncbi:MAG: SulA-like leucine-rich domain-containing protein [Oleiphilus sp.]
MKQLSIYENDYLDSMNANFRQAKPSTMLSQVAPEVDNCHTLPVQRTSHINEKSEPSTETHYPANVTEIVLAGDKVDSIQLVLPMLINLHQERRWLAWIDPPIQLLKEWQKTHQDDTLNDVMILRSNDNLSVYELSKRALEAGTCHAVIAWTNSLNQEQFAKLEAASSTGNSHGIILKSRQQP